MINGVLHCGYCGLPMHQCPGCDAEHTALMRAVCDAMSLLNVTAPINTPPVKPPLPPRVKFGGYYICQGCNMAAEFCACARQSAPDVPPKDGGETSLVQRAKDWKGKP